ncbi:MAG: filamentous hemagglutinin N-terminal domain-containing protein, partial [Cyanobacteria bacterium P01_G01_bin.39]
MKKALFSPLQISLCTVGYLWATGSSIQAQVTSDGTVNTIVTPNGNVAEITGGETRGSNLFHSFQEFSVNTGNEASFLNADSISNIFSRVTGGNISNIDGLIRANGSANLFLINPAGILFGENASLSIGGSFYGSTADSILFEGGEFSAADLENPPLLTVNAPIGLGFRDNPADISVTGNSNAGIFANLAVNPGQNFTLVGGNLSFDTGFAIAPSGRIELGGLSESGVVSLNEDFSFNFTDNVARADIDFTNGAGISVASEEGGSINLNARNLTLTGGSRIIGGLVATEVNVTDAEAGNVTINATDTISLDGINPASGLNSAIQNNVESGAVGNAGDVQITSKNLSITNGGQIQTIVRQANPVFELSAGEGNGGNIKINTEEAVTISGVSEVFNLVTDQMGNTIPNSFPSLISSSLDLGATGESGAISITSGSLDLNDGGVIISSTSGIGNAGNITLDISNDISFDGVNQSISGGILGGIFSNVESGAVGNGG